ncbi:MAG TPA: hypothetical protein VK184_15630 [Nostocaceae cyanobacterium]|nr:hypothetical protein [Nostocaceae cyanobacterium]
MFGKKPSSNPETNHDMTGLIKVSGCDNPNRRGDVIFVHGLAGHPWYTWHWQKPEDKDYQQDDFWLKWLGEEFPDIGIWTFGYSAAQFWPQGSSMPLLDLANYFLYQLEIHDIGNRPIIFITHSMGGLLVKKMLRTAMDFPEVKSKRIVIESTKGIVFLSTPHQGSDVANWVQFLAGIVAGDNVKELIPNDPQLRELHRFYRQWVEELKIKTQVFFETERTNGVYVVTESSADPDIKNVQAIPVPQADHNSIVKLKPRDNHVYPGIKKFIGECLIKPKALPPGDPNLDNLPQTTPEKNINPHQAL